MAVTKTDGSVVANDSSTVPVTIITDNMRDYGDPVNSNFVRLAENFAHTSAPADAKILIGQLWFDTRPTHRKLKVRGYAGNATERQTASIDWQELVQQNDDVDFGTLTADGDVTLGGSSSPTINITGTTNITGVTAFDGSTTFNVNGDTESVSIIGSSEFDGSVTITANGTRESVSVTGPTTITGSLSVDTGHTTSLGGDTTITGDLRLGGDALIAGDLTVSGTMTTVNANQVDLGDNILVLNADKTNAPASSDRAGIEFERGTSNNVQFRWNESSDKLEVGQVTYSGSGVRQGTVADVSNSFSNILLESDTSITAVANRIPKYNSAAKLVGDITGQSGSISNHNIEGLSNVVATNRDANNKWLKWNNTGSRYEPAAIAWADIPSISYNDNKFTGTLSENNGGTGQTSLGGVKTWLNIENPVNTSQSTNQSLSWHIGANRTGIDYDVIPINDISPQVMQIRNVTKDRNISGDSYNYPNWTRVLTITDSNFRLMDARMYLRCVHEGDRDSNTGNLLRDNDNNLINPGDGSYEYNEWAPIENFYGFFQLHHGLPVPGGEEHIFPAVSLRIKETFDNDNNSTGYEFYIRRNNKLAEGHYEYDRTGPVSAASHELDWSKWRFTLLAFGGRF